VIWRVELVYINDALKKLPANFDANIIRPEMLRLGFFLGGIVGMWVLWICGYMGIVGMWVFRVQGKDFIVSLLRDQNF